MKWQRKRLSVPKILGHGKYGEIELLDYTINMYKPNKWGDILKISNIQVFEYLEILYNKKKRHPYLNYQTIEELNVKSVA